MPAVHEYQAKIDKQTREIQRLKTQVQLLLEKGSDQTYEDADPAQGVGSLMLPTYPQPPSLAASPTAAQTIHSISRKTDSTLSFLAMQPLPNNDEDDTYGYGDHTNAASPS
ncbi:hypothetical protein SPRG_16532 [Saprolegnia parasitica CBS 223.65]|uniref:Uncharacterized protein n=1 Tax=Saprolegnia parasitica (strain CBS 223.65) TaxID=695850 RepID=A0A067BTX6_SAPPC|nr:hypothetical protein SPRG_16532 [Saprolegnia parasitica CBS 223.65]KDO18092.1 hypothetical protein SPRG_16532 [Saprolegnia parasitica CBS 223.65]|eukprot:XP_012211197.1 hypothetical protein SPRG_16532 [Saprolegnia parasitica CBS 223.65]